MQVVKRREIMFVDWGNRSAGLGIRMIEAKEKLQSLQPELLTILNGKYK